jgi:hypothetical protein
VDGGWGWAADSWLPSLRVVGAPFNPPPGFVASTDSDSEVPLVKLALASIVGDVRFKPKTW